MNTITASPQSTRNSPSSNKNLYVREHSGDKPIDWVRPEAGDVYSPTQSKDLGWLSEVKKRAWEALIPENVETNVSKDYAATRKWQLTRDFFGSMGGTASLAAVLTAMVPAQTALAGLAVAGLTVANVGWAKDRLGQFTSFLSSNALSKKAEQNPRPWILAADVVSNVGTVVDASTAILPPMFYYPLQFAMTLIRSVGGAASGAAQAGIAPRQALANNLGEVGSKNANQGAVASFLGSTAGIGALAALGSSIGFAPAALTIASAAAGAGLFATYKKIQNLDYNPVNEQAIRRVVKTINQSGEVPGPNANVVSELPTLWDESTLIAGQPIRPLLEQPGFQGLRDLYATTPYLLGIVDGKPYIVLKDDAETEDSVENHQGLSLMTDYGKRMAQVRAVYQGVLAEDLLASPDYQKMAKDKGTQQADLWVVQESFAKTPKSVAPLLEEMKKKGWSTDILAFQGQNRPVLLSSSPLPAQENL